MSFGLSVLARRLMVDPAGAKASLKVPALLWEAPPQDGTDSGHWMMTDAGHSLRRPRAGEPLIMLVEKVPGRKNPFAMGVTVGRVESNDIIVDDGSVSRFHAWLQYDERLHTWQLTDAESKNGTWINGQKLPGKQRTTLADGAELKLGDVLLRFLLPDALLAFVDQASRR
ncbi:MAG: FHA domain-containing protein [Myxococcales bacterium]|nr:FHA domain-containing protein [Myxococcales bacterium]